MGTASNPRPCRIKQVGLTRNGKPRWWCPVHGGNATGSNGTKLHACEAMTIDADLAGCLNLDPDEYPGGIALWAALEPIFDTSGRPAEAGIHVHARQRVGKVKVIDSTYPAVAVQCAPDLFGPRSVLVTRRAAISYYLSRFTSRRIKFLTCPHCREVHLDAGRFAIHAHRKHLCQSCGRLFQDEDTAVSNPVAFICDALGDVGAASQPVRAARCLNIRQADYPGGIQIWASNPAIVWTALRSEEEGIHMHLFADRRGPPVEDETFDRVVIDGECLDDVMVHYLMAQQAFPALEGKIESLNCPDCDGAHFDQGELAFEPHGEHTCEHCGAGFRASGRRRLSVSNPLISTLERLRRNESINRLEVSQ